MPMVARTVNVFETLNKIDVSEHVEKKGQFNYLSWAHAVRELLKVCPNATWEVHLFGICGEERPYMKTETGCFVQVTVDVDGIKRTQIHPVLDNRNNTIKEPNSFQINTSIQRCLAKAIALHGLGLYIFAGEDLPQAEELKEGEIKTLDKLMKKAGELKLKDEKLNLYGQMKNALDEGKINSNNYGWCTDKLNKIIEEQGK